MTCSNCGKVNARIRHITRTYGEGDNLVIVENVPAVFCPDCKESYFTSDIAEELDRIRTSRIQGRKRLVNVVTLAG